jgi:outer membrane protein assembly factor BamD (BamD/ComL family)
MFSGPPKPPPPPAESMVLRADGLVDEKPPVESPGDAMLAGAREYFRLNQYDKAAALYSRVADNKKNPINAIAEARYYEAECYRLEGQYPKAADIYVDLLNKFPQNPYREQAVQHMFDIANYWLDDTRSDMKAYRDQREGKRWCVWPTVFYWDKTKPFLDERGRAIEKLEQVRFNDINGPLADKALFLCGSVKFFEEDYRDADHYFSQIYERHPNSPLAAKALELAIVSKHLSTGGPEYDGRKVAEARKLVHAALESYPELANKKRGELEKQLIFISEQQAAKEYGIAEYYKRTGHAPSAYFYYELVARRYPGTDHAKKAEVQLAELKQKLEKTEHGTSTTPPLPQQPPATAPQSPPVPETAPAPRTLPSGVQHP